jgi:nucleoside-diphosphate kinase
MSIEYTFSMIKPDAVERNIIGNINSCLEKAGLKIVAQKMLQLNKALAEEFYAEHKDRPFFASLVNYIISGPVIVQVLKGDNGILKNREIMGATNPKEAAMGTIRNTFGLSIEANSIHGSDSKLSAEREIKFFFAQLEIVE